MALRGDVENQLKGQLDDQQYTKLGTLNVDLLGVRTGHDPIGEYVQARLQ